MSEAEKLENLVNELYINTVNVETVLPILRLLIELKNFQTDTDTIQVLVLLSIIQLIINLLKSSKFIEANTNTILYSLYRMYFTMVKPILVCLKTLHPQMVYQCFKHIPWNPLSCRRSLRPCWAFVKLLLGKTDIHWLILLVQCLLKINIYQKLY